MYLEVLFLMFGILIVRDQLYVLNNPERVNVNILHVEKKQLTTAFEMKKKTVKHHQKFYETPFFERSRSFRPPIFGIHHSWGSIQKNFKKNLGGRTSKVKNHDLEGQK